MVADGWVKLRFWDRMLLPPKKIRPMGLIAAQMSINPFELYLLVAICLIGVLYVVGLPPPSSVKQLLPSWAVQVWAVNLGVGGALALFGGLARIKLERGLAAYQFGWGLIGVGALVYGLALVILFPTQAVYQALSNIFWSVACFTRVIQVQRFFKLSAQVVRARLLPEESEAA